MTISPTFSSTYMQFSGETQAGKPLDRAIAFARRAGRLPVFAKETDKGRSFVVTGYNSLFVRHLSVPLHSRACYHEYIMGACNLFIDIDAARYGNNHMYPDDEACELIVKAVLQQLYHKFHIRRQQVQIIQLDSSDETKVSRHLIFNIADKKGYYRVAWRSSRECGLFMRQVLCQLPQSRYPGLYVKGESRASRQSSAVTRIKGGNAGADVEHSIVDMQVYGNKKCLRTYMSAKPKCPSRLLRLSSETHRSPPQFTTFLQSLVCYFVGNESKRIKQLLQLSQQTPSSQLSSDATLLFAQLPASCRKRTLPSSSSFSPAECPAECPAEYMKLVQQTLPFQLYGQKYDAEEQRLFTRTRSQECELAQKKHEKNHVYYVFDFRAGVYWQGCPNYTHGCNKKRGVSRPIPGYTTQLCGKRRRGADCLSLPSFYPRRSSLKKP